MFHLSHKLTDLFNLVDILTSFYEQNILSIIDTAELYQIHFDVTLANAELPAISVLMKSAKE